MRNIESWVLTAEKLDWFVQGITAAKSDITKEEIDKAVFLYFHIFLNPYIPNHHKTLSLKQESFLLLTDREALFGGSAGGGKSDALLMAALMFVIYPNYRAIMFRKTYTDLSLPDSLMDRASSWLQETDAHWSDKNKTWEFPNGATISFAYLQSSQDKYRYQGTQMHAIFYDEVTQFKEEDYLYLFSRLRKAANDPIPLRMRCATNPGNIGHEWVKARFIEGGEPDAVFIKSLLTDNPFLDQESYRKALSKLDPVTRQQLENGDWDISASGNMFKQHWFEILPVLDSRYLKHRVRFWDLAATLATGSNDPDYCVGLLMGMASATDMCIIDIVRIRLSEAETEATISHTVQRDGYAVEQYFEQEGGGSAKLLFEAWKKGILKGYNAKFDKPNESKELRAKLPSAAAERGEIKVLEAEWNRAFFSEVTRFPEVAHDDQCISGESIITTKRGDVLMRDIKIGDCVLSVDGYHRVTNHIRVTDKACAYKINTLNGAYIIGTSDHLIRTNRGWVQICDLIPGDITWQNQRKLNLTVLSSDDTQNQKLNPTSDISGHTQDISGMGCSTYIKRFGNRCMVISQMGLQFITEMGIGLITTSPISNVLQKVNIVKYTRKNITEIIERLLYHTLIKLDLLRQSGIKAQRVESGIFSTQKRLLQISQNQILASVLSAVTSFYHIIKTRNSVHPCVVRETDAPKKQICDCVNGVGRSFSQIRNHGKNVVVSFVPVVSVEVIEYPIPVYDITVENSHSFFANDILVHNCDAFSGAFRRLLVKSGVSTSKIPHRKALPGLIKGGFNI